MASLDLPRRLVLLRHAKSSWEDPSRRDFDRPLAPRGESAAPRMAAVMAEADLAPEWVLCSPARRTRETWVLVAPTFDLPPVEVFDPSLYLASARTLLARVRETPARISTILLIGHNPGLRDLAAELASGADGEIGATVGAKFPTAALLALEFDTADWSGVGTTPCTILVWRTPKGREPLES